MSSVTKNEYPQLTIQERMVNPNRLRLLIRLCALKQQSVMLRSLVGNPLRTLSTPICHRSRASFHTSYHRNEASDRNYFRTAKSNPAAENEEPAAENEEPAAENEEPAHSTEEDSVRDERFMLKFIEKNVITDIRYNSVEDWDVMMEKFLSLQREVKFRDAFVQRILHAMRLALINWGHVDHDEGLDALILSLSEYIVAKGIPYRKLNFRIDAMLLKLRFHGDKHVKEVADEYEEIMKENKFFDGPTIEILMLVCCLLPQWKDCYRLYDMFVVTEPRPSKKVLQALLRASVRNNEMEEVCRLMDLFKKEHGELDDHVFSALFDIIEHQDTLEEVLLYLSKEKSHTILSQVAIDKCKQKFESFGKKVGVQWSFGEYNTKERKICPYCFTPREPIKPISSEDFETLRSGFLSNLLYDATHPSVTKLKRSTGEIEAFREFLNRKPAFTIVVDVMNVVYLTHSTRWKPKNVAERTYPIKKVMDYFGRKNEKVLAVSKQHMKKHVEKYEYINTEWFFTDNKTEDDWFVIWAAMNSGRHCCVVTSDTMRDHCYKYGEHSKAFKEWQLQRQIIFTGIYKNEPWFKFPETYHVGVQRTPYGWHIPYEDNEPRAPFRLPQSWFCLKSDVVNKDIPVRKGINLSEIL